MNKRQKIIVSIVGIFIVLLALVGITYGYFLTRIIGNTNDTSVSITTALLELKYQDDNNTILTYENAVPNTQIGSKSFTVTNTGDGKVNGYGVYLENVINEMDRPQDLEITLTCKSVNTETEAESGTCEGITTTFPKTDALIVTNDIEVKTRHEYTMTIKYLEANINQSVDMGKTVEAKINIYQPENVVDIMGTISGSETGDYVEINSTPKVSEIVNGKYHLKNVEFGNHTLFVKSSTGAVKGSVNLVIDKGDSNSIDNVNKKVIASENTASVSIDINSVSNTLGIDIKSINEEVAGINASSVALNPELYYGKMVNYVPQLSGATNEWQIFHSDGTNIYLISKDFIDYTKAPGKNSAVVTTAEHSSGYTRNVNISAVAAQYDTVTKIQNAVMSKWIDSQFVDTTYLTNNLNPDLNEGTVKGGNMQAVAYLQDQDVWDVYKDATGHAEYALGGTPIQLFVDSYNVSHPGTSITVGTKATDFWGRNLAWGYSLSLNGNSLAFDISSGLTWNTGFENNQTQLYLDPSNVLAYGYWVASPSGNSPNALLSISVGLSSGVATSLKINYNEPLSWPDRRSDMGALNPDIRRGLRPIICLKSNTVLVESSDSNYDFNLN